jgi:hypothetical protein
MGKQAAQRLVILGTWTPLTGHPKIYNTSFRQIAAMVAKSEYLREESFISMVSKRAPLSNPAAPACQTVRAPLLMHHRD